jgi:hypothetical protein
MIALPWFGSLALIATLCTPSMANIPPEPPFPAQVQPITGEPPLLIDTDGYVISLIDGEEAE